MLIHSLHAHRRWSWNDWSQGSRLRRPEQVALVGRGPHRPGAGQAIRSPSRSSRICITIVTPRGAVGLEWERREVVGEERRGGREPSRMDGMPFQAARFRARGMRYIKFTLLLCKEAAGHFRRTRLLPLTELFSAVIRSSSARLELQRPKRSIHAIRPSLTVESLPLEQNL